MPDAALQQAGAQIVSVGARDFDLGKFPGFYSFPAAWHSVGWKSSPMPTRISFSGGMRRRVALLMSLARDPRILMLDEPFGAPDAHTRTSLHAELVRKPHSFNVESISIGVPKKNELIQPCVAANCQMSRRSR